LYKAKSEEIDIDQLKERFYETSSYDVSENRINKVFEYFLEVLKREGVKI